MFTLPIQNDIPQATFFNFTLTCPACVETFEKDFYRKPDNKFIIACKYCSYRTTLERYLDVCSHGCDCLRKNHEAEKYVASVDKILQDPADVTYYCTACNSKDVARMGINYKCYDCGNYGFAVDIDMDPKPQVMITPKPDVKPKPIGIPFNIPPVSSTWNTFKGYNPDMSKLNPMERKDLIAKDYIEWLNVRIVPNQVEDRPSDIVLPSREE